MARRHDAAGWLVLIGLVAVGWAWQWASENTVQAIGIGCIVVTVGISVIASHRTAKNDNTAGILRSAREAAQLHARKLSIKRDQLLLADDYGKLRFEGWERELAYFIENVVLVEARSKGCATQHIERDNPAWLDLETAIEAEIDAFDRKKEEAELEAIEADINRIERSMENFFSGLPDGEDDPIDEAAPIPLSGIDYEHFCRRALGRRGWQVTMTPATGDQGADLIGEKKGLRAVIQCKFYSRPVGNKAVQEVFAAKQFQQADLAAVLTNKSFTKSARQLAQSVDVMLLHHDELDQLNARAEQLL